MPGKETTDFLDGLLDMLLTEDPKIQHFLSGEKTGFLKSFGNNRRQEDVRRELTVFAADSIEENIIFFITATDKNTHEDGNAREGIWKSASGLLLLGDPNSVKSLPTLLLTKR